MDLQRKIEVAKAALDSITTHDDADSTLRKASLDTLSSYATEGKTKIDAAAAADIAALTSE